jgi:glycolate oxidase FAD binding subunit
VVRQVRHPSEIATLVGELLDSTLAPTAIEVDLPPHPTLPRQRDGVPLSSGQIAVLFEGSVPGVPVRCEAAVALLGPDTSIVDEAPSWWGRYPFDADQIALRFSLPVADLYAAVYALRDVAGTPIAARGSAGVGVLYAALPAALPASRVTSILEAVRTTLIARNGTCMVLSAPSPLREEIDMWGPVGGLDLMRRVKAQFDPGRRLAPGRFVGGI